MLNKTINPSLSTRAWGALQAAGGAVEAVIASYYITQSGGVGAILGGGVLLAHGADGVATEEFIKPIKNRKHGSMRVIMAMKLKLENKE